MASSLIKYSFIHLTPLIYYLMSDSWTEQSRVISYKIAESGRLEIYTEPWDISILGSNLEFNLNWILASTILQLGPQSGMIMYLQTTHPPKTWRVTWNLETASFSGIEMSQKVLRRDFEGLESVYMVSGRCLDEVWKVSGRCLEGY